MNITNWKRFRYSPSALKVYNDHCPAALDFYQDRDRVRDEVPYAVGVAAHYIIEHVGKLAHEYKGDIPEDVFQKAVDELCEALIEVGRRGDNIPLPPDSVYEGRDIALGWMLKNPPSPDDIVEPAQAFDREWNPVAWDSGNARYRLVFDFLAQYQDGDEEGLMNVLHVRDYKTAWSTSEEELGTVQLRSQAVAGLIYADYLNKKLHEDDVIDIVRVEVVNLRTHQRFHRDHFVGQTPEIEQFRRDVEATMDAADEQAKAGWRKARPGANCCGCPYVFLCEAAQEYFQQSGIPKTKEERARLYAIVDTMRSQLQKLCKKDFEEEGAIEIDGRVLANHPTNTSVITHEDSKNAYAMFQGRGGDVNGFIAAIGGLGKTQIDKLAKTLYPDDKEQRLRFVEMIVKTETAPRFQFKKKKREENV